MESHMHGLIVSEGLYKALSQRRQVGVGYQRLEVLDRDRDGLGDYPPEDASSST
jgi:hypothetical protein